MAVPTSFWDDTITGGTGCTTVTRTAASVYSHITHNANIMDRSVKPHPYAEWSHSKLMWEMPLSRRSSPHDKYRGMSSDALDAHAYAIKDMQNMYRCPKPIAKKTIQQELQDEVNEWLKGVLI